MLSRQSQRRPAQQQQARPYGAGAQVNVQPLPEYTICPGAPRMGPIPLPPIPAEQQYGLYTPPSSPRLGPIQYVAAPATPTSNARRSPSTRSSRGYHPQRNESLFSDADMDEYAPTYGGGGGNNEMVWSATGPTANELWLQRTQQTPNAYGGSSHIPSWMPPPSSSISMRASYPAAEPYSPSASTSASRRRVHFARGAEDGGNEHEAGSWGYQPGFGQQDQGYGQMNGGRGGGGGGRRGYGPAGGGSNKRAWEGRRGGEEDEDGEDHEEEEDDDSVPRARRRGR